MELVDQKGVSQIRTCLMKQDHQFCCGKMQNNSELPIIECHRKVKHNSARQTLAEFRSNILVNARQRFCKEDFI